MCLGCPTIDAAARQLRTVRQQMSLRVSSFVPLDAILTINGGTRCLADGQYEQASKNGTGLIEATSTIEYVNFIWNIRIFKLLPSLFDFDHNLTTSETACPPACSCLLFTFYKLSSLRNERFLSEQSTGTLIYLIATC